MNPAYLEYLESRIADLKDAHIDCKAAEADANTIPALRTPYNSAAAGLWDTIVELDAALTQYRKYHQPTVV